MGAGAVMATSVAAASDAVMGRYSFAFPMGKLSNKLVTVASFSLVGGGVPSRDTLKPDANVRGKKCGPPHIGET
ncbi:hypothetical protein GCM10009612_08880 [Streptomyces beijiangensis]